MCEITAPRAWFLLIPLFLLLARYPLLKQNHLCLPPSPLALPILGHLHLVGSLPHVSFRSLARKHGYDDFMLLRLGAMPVLVVSSPRAAEAVLRTHDHVFPSRPHSVVSEVVMYGPSNIGFAPYGEYWRQGKKLVTTQLLSVRRVKAFRFTREEGVRTVMGQIGGAAVAGASLDVGELLASLTNDLACRAVMGESFRRDGRNKLLRQLVVDTSQLLGGFNIEEFFPFLARFGVVSKAVRAKSERLRRRWDELLDRLIQDHENESHPHPNKDGGDFIHVLLSFRQEYGLEKEHLKGLLVVSTTSSQLDRGICIANYIEEQPFAGI
jgi:cytochrome P450